MGRYDDRATRPARGPADLLRWQVERVRARLRGERAQEPAGWDPPRVANDGSALAATSPHLTWIGHATFVMRLGGKLVATDPVWCERISGVVARRSPPGVALEDLPPLDFVTVTHNHRDHMDLPSLCALAEHQATPPTFVVPAGNARFLEEAGLRDVVELDWWQTHDAGALRITLVPARHWSMRMPWDRNDGLWGGFVFAADEGTAYHAGDTAFFEDAADIGARFAIDWAMLPIGAYEPRWFMEPQHMNPDDAVQLFGRLGARNLVAMHWGTFRLTDEALHEPPERLRALWAESAHEAARMWLMAIGETRALAR